MGGQDGDGRLAADEQLRAELLQEGARLGLDRHEIDRLQRVTSHQRAVLRRHAASSKRTLNTARVIASLATHHA